MSGNRSLINAAANKEDEFYTQLPDIEDELRHYRDHFRDKTVYCNCDDPRESGFFHYFSYNFEALGLKKLIATCYKNQSRDLFTKNNSERAIYLEYYGDNKGDTIPKAEDIGIKYLNGDGDFRSEECIELLKEADIVVTNPPFSLFREYISQLIEYNKQFIIIGSQNGLTNTEVFKHIKDNKIWTGYNSGDMSFRVPSYYEERRTRYWVDSNGDKWRSMGNICWYTNIEISKRHEDLILYKQYTPEEYPTYDNYGAIEVKNVSEIPEDYYELMGVPVTFLEKFNPDQFELIGIPTGNSGKVLGVTRNYRGRTDISITRNGRTSCPYSRIIIRRRRK
jgi:hypothetical protein